MWLKNPFIISGYVSPAYFCDREQETKNLVRYLLNGRNVAIISTRRMGKTGLIRHCFQQKEIKEHYNTFFIDIYSTGSLREFVFALGKEIFEELKPKERKLMDQFFSIITSLRAGFKLDSISGEPSFDIGLGDIQDASITLEEIFSYLEHKAITPSHIAAADCGIQWLHTKQRPEIDGALANKLEQQPIHKEVAECQRAEYRG